MRTTLPLEPDVASRVESLLKQRDLSRKELINELLRRGLDEYSRQEPKGRFSTGGMNLGTCLRQYRRYIRDIVYSRRR